MLRPALLLNLLLLISFTTHAQEYVEKINPELLHQRWQAQWIQHPTASASGYGVFHFRKGFEIANRPEEFLIHVSADNRYKLFVNGTEVGLGPARGDQLHWYYETYDISKLLVAGRNVIAALVWNMGNERPLAQISYQTALIIQGNSQVESIINTNTTWKVIQSEAYQPIHVTLGMVRGYYAAGAMDHLDGSKYLWGWKMPDFDDSGWERCRNIGYGGEGVPYGFTEYSAMSAWQLIPRDIPLMEQKMERIPNIVRSSADKNNNGFLTGTGSRNIEANSHLKMLLDLGHLTTAYPLLVCSGGRGSEIMIKYAEALAGPDGKGNRNEIGGKEIYGVYDIFVPGGGVQEVFTPLWYRTYRFIELEITTGDEPLVLDDFYGVFTAYPFQEKGKFTSENEMLDRIWEVGWRTARLCAMETYMDCPYYEQLQYVGDTRIQALISLYVSGDCRLMKKAIRQFDQSRFFEGLTMSRHPTYIPQVSPPYSLIQILMIHDFMMYVGDKDFISEMTPGIESVLSWFEQQVDTTGLTGLLNWVNYMDAAQGFKSGTPPYQHEGHSAQINLLYAYAVKKAAEIFAYLDYPPKTELYQKVYERIIEKVKSTCYDREKGLFAETPAKQYYTQHTNILAILTDAIPKQNQSELMDKILYEPSLTKAEIYFQFYLFEALRKTGKSDLYLDLIGDWYSMIEQGLTTFAEHRDRARSDCHAWSSHPIYGFLATICGIRPLAPAFEEIEIVPSLGNLNHIEALVPHPRGEIIVQLAKRNDQLTGTVTIPPDVTASLKWQGETIDLKPGAQLINLE